MSPAPTLLVTGFEPDPGRASGASRRVFALTLELSNCPTVQPRRPVSLCQAPRGRDRGAAANLILFEHDRRDC